LPTFYTNISIAISYLGIYDIILPLDVQPVHKKAWHNTKEHISLQTKNRIFIWNPGAPTIYGTRMLGSDAFSRNDSLRPSFTITFTEGRGNEAGNLKCPVCPVQMQVCESLQNAQQSLPPMLVTRVCVRHLYKHTLSYLNCRSVQCDHGLVGCPSCGWLTTIPYQESGFVGCEDCAWVSVLCHSTAQCKGCMHILRGYGEHISTHIDDLLDPRKFYCRHADGCGVRQHQVCSCAPDYEAI
jgi:hypothetical protein